MQIIKIIKSFSIAPKGFISTAYDNFNTEKSVKKSPFQEMLHKYMKKNHILEAPEVEHVNIH